MPTNSRSTETIEKNSRIFHVHDPNVIGDKLFIDLVIPKKQEIISSASENYHQIVTINEDYFGKLI